MTWRFMPDTLTGSEGKAASFNLQHDYEVNQTKLGTDWWCYVRNGTVGGLRGGSWLIRAELPTWNATCLATLHGGNDLANFTYRRSGCREDATFP